MDQVTGGALLAQTLQAAGVEEVFSLHGGHLDAFLVACRDHGLRLTDTRHEASAGHAAEAYARATGRIGVAVVTAGPGFTNAYTAMANAYLDRMPVLFVVGAPSSREADLNTLQGGVDQVAAASHVTKWAFRVPHGSRLPEIVAQAMRRALSGPPGPVMLEIPIDVMFTPIKPPEHLPPASAYTPAAAPGPSDAEARDLLDRIASAARPVIVAGGGATLSRCGEALLTFARRASISVVTGAKADGLLPQDDPVNGGGLVSLAVTSALGQPADLVILLGHRIGLFTGGRHGLIPKTAQVVQVDIDGAEPGRGGAVDLSIQADARAALDALIAAAANRAFPDRSVWAATLKAARDLPNQRWDDAPVHGDSGLLHPFHAAKAIVDALPRNAVVVCDGGESSVWLRDHLRTEGVGSSLITGYLGTLGVGQGFAVGAARAFPDRPIVLLAGDGGVGFHIQEFDTFVRHGLSVTTVVFNNACWGMSQNGQDLIYGTDRRAIVELRDTAYEKVAEAFGGVGLRAERLDEIGPAIATALASGRPACVNVRVDGAVINPVTIGMVGLPAGSKAKGPKTAEAPSPPAKVVMPYYENVD